MSRTGQRQKRVGLLFSWSHSSIRLSQCPLHQTIGETHARFESALAIHLGLRLQHAWDVVQQLLRRLRCDRRHPRPEMSGVWRPMRSKDRMSEARIRTKKRMFEAKKAWSFEFCVHFFACTHYLI